MTLGQRLKTLIESSDLQVKEVARAIGRCRATVYKIMADKPMLPRTLHRLLKAFPQLKD